MGLACAQTVFGRRNACSIALATESAAADRAYATWALLDQTAPCKKQSFRHVQQIAQAVARASMKVAHATPGGRATTAAHHA